MRKFHVICIFESYLYSDTSTSDDNLNIHSYNMSCSDHSSGIRHGGVRIYYKESLPIKTLNINYLQECTRFDQKIRRTRCAIVWIYRSPSKSANEFENFLNKLNLTMEAITQKNPFLAVVIGVIRSSKWWVNDNTTKEVLIVENFSSQFFVLQVINKPTHISQNFNSCIDLLFANQKIKILAQEFILHVILIAITKWFTKSLN